MEKKHFIKEIADILSEEYAETNQGVSYYNGELSKIMRDKDHSEEWKGKEHERIVRERSAYVASRRVELEDKVKAVIDTEKATITAAATSRVPTGDQLAMLSMLKSMKALSQAEFDAFAVSLKGIYTAEKAMSEIANERNLQYKFVPLDWQMKRIDDFTDKLKHCYNYTGDVTHDRYGKVMYDFGSGVPFFAQMLINDPNGFIEEYDRDKFEVTPAVPSAMERLNKLKTDFPDKCKDIDKFIKDNEYSLGAEIFASRLDEFINSVAEKSSAT